MKMNTWVAWVGEFEERLSFIGVSFPYEANKYIVGWSVNEESLCPSNSVRKLNQYL